MSRAIRLTLFTLLLAAIFIAWRASHAHLYNPTVRTPVPLPRAAYTPTPNEISARIYGLNP